MALAELTKVLKHGTTFYVNEENEIVLKDCRKCGQTKALNEYSPNAGGRDGRHSKCRVCLSEYQIDRDPEYIKDWQKNNPDKVTASTHNYRAKKLGLPAELTHEIVKEIREEQQGRCILSGLEDNLHFEHAIPLHKGRGSTYENCYFVNEYLNRAMKTTNMFEWVKGQYNFIQRRFYNVFVPMMAERNGMTPKEYEVFVYEKYNVEKGEC